MAKKTIQENAEALLAARKPHRGRPKLWKNYSRNEKIVAIAYDIIQAVLAGVYVPTEHNYVEPHSIMSKGHQQLQSVLTSGELDNCGVCALGAAFLSLVRFENHKLCDDPIRLHDKNSTDTQRIRTLLGRLRMEEIMVAYECKQLEDTMFWLSPRRFESIVRKYQPLNREERMLNIWMNVIKHQGVFTP